MKSYKEILDDVKKANPKLSHKDCLMKASILFREEKSESEASAPAEAVIPIVKPIPMMNKHAAESLNPDEIEHKIRKAGVDIHNIQRIGLESSKNFELIKAGKDGVNTLVYLDGPCRVPRNGYFIIWI